MIMINKIEHPSSVLVDQNHIDKSTLYFPDHLALSMGDQILHFRANFISLEHAARDFSTSEIKDIILKNRNKVLEDFAEKLVDCLCNGSGFVNLKDFFVEDSDENVAISLFILGCYLGEPTYNNRDRKYIWPVISQQVESTKKIEGNIRYGNTGAPLPFHTDTGTFAGLLCIAPASEGGENVLISAVSVHNNIYDVKPELLAVLYQDFYIDRRGEEMDGDSPVAKLPVFGVSDKGRLKTFWSDYYNYDAYTKYNIEPLTPEQQAAYRILKEQIAIVHSSKKVSLKTEKGDVLFVNNNLIFHNRTPFVNNNGVQRKLLRIWVNNKKYDSFPHMFGYDTSVSEESSLQVATPL